MESLPAYDHWRRRLGEGVQEGNAVLSRRPITGTGHKTLEAGELADRRTILFAAVKTPAGTVPFFTTQLSSPPDQSALRCAQVAQVAASSPGSGRRLPPVLTGDLNAEPDSDEIRMLCGHKTAPAVPGQVLVDAWRYAEPGPGDTWDRSNPFVRATHEPSSRIDYVLVGPPGKDGAGHVVRAWPGGAEPVSRRVAVQTTPPSPPRSRSERCASRCQISSNAVRSAARATPRRCSRPPCDTRPSGAPAQALAVELDLSVGEADHGVALRQLRVLDDHVVRPPASLRLRSKYRITASRPR